VSHITQCKLFVQYDVGQFRGRPLESEFLRATLGKLIARKDGCRGADAKIPRVTLSKNQRVTLGIFAVGITLIVII
jgi:hypothetical protein